MRLRKSADAAFRSHRAAATGRRNRRHVAMLEEKGWV
jgi:hypothetical protein